MTGRKDSGNRASLVLSLIAIFVSVVSAGVIFWTSYSTIWKSLDLELRVYPTIQIQHKGNLGIYLDVTFINESPQLGIVSETGVVLYKVDNPDDKYLLEFVGFRKLEDKRVYRDAEDKLPMAVPPNQWSARTLNYLYKMDDEFPISPGTYVCELHVWTNYETVAEYSKVFKFEISSDILDGYKKLRDVASSSLQSITISGHVSLESKKLSLDEYRQLRDRVY